MSLRVVLTDAAKDDVRTILSWIEQRSPAGAEAWFAAWIDAIHLLSERAEALAKAPESDDHAEPIRQLLFKTKRGRRYRALFAVRGDEAFVLHVRGPGQDRVRRGSL